MCKCSLSGKELLIVLIVISLCKTASTSLLQDHYFKKKAYPGRIRLTKAEPLGELPSVLVKFSVSFADRCLHSLFPAQAVTFTPCPTVLLPPSCYSFLQGHPAISHGALATDCFVFLRDLSSAEQDTASSPSRLVPSFHPSFCPQSQISNTCRTRTMTVVDLGHLERQELQLMH